MYELIQDLPYIYIYIYIYGSANGIFRDYLMAFWLSPRPHYQPESFSLRADNGRGFDTEGSNQNPIICLSHILTHLAYRANAKEV